MILFDQVSKKYPDGKEALSRISFEVPSGDMLFLTGHSGAGKSTLLQIILRMLRPSSGNVLVNGRDLSRLKRRMIPAHRREIGVVFQDHQLLQDRSVFENVALPLLVCGHHPREVGRRVRAALDKVGLLGREKASPQSLSGGEQQRVGIARAVVNKPPVLLADEPTGNLDPQLSAEVMELFEQFNQVGVTVLIASHDLGLVAKMKKPVLTLSQGRLLGQGLAPPIPGVDIV